MNKIIHLQQVTKIKRKNKKVVLVGGCFDIFHIGHLYFLKNAKKAEEILVVALEPDEKVKTLKGSGRPIHSQVERAEILANLELVDFVLLLPKLTTDQDYFSLVKTIKPDVVAVTENDLILDKKRQQAKAVGAKLVVIPKIETPSTTQLAKLLKID